MSDQNQDTSPTNEAPASLAAVAGSETFANWWIVEVELRREDKTITWQRRAAFFVEDEAHAYVGNWRPFARARIIPPNSDMSQPRGQGSDKHE